MKIATSMVAVLIVLVATPALAGEPQRDTGVSATEVQQDRGQPKRAGQKQAPRESKPKPKPKPPPRPPKESGEKGGTEDLNIGVGELNE